jgi:Fe-Mn family superoxide dismutase
MSYQLPKLPWTPADLKPFLSTDQVETHYSGHHKAYVDKVNKAIVDQKLGNPTLESLILNQEGGLFNNAAQAWNHTFYWYGLAPKAKGPDAGGRFMGAVNKKFGGMDGLRDRFMDAGTSLFGSGWTWIVATKEGDLDIANTQNADNPMRLKGVRPLWTCDIWEHAYYIDYKNVRKTYLERAWEHVNWDFVAANYEGSETPNMSKLMM